MPDDIKDWPSPWRVSDRVVAVSLTGYLVPCHEDGQPVLARMDGTENRYLLAFSTHAKLVSICSGQVGYARIVQIADGPEFLAGLRESVLSFTLHVAVDPWRTDSGTFRFTQVWLDIGNPDRKPV